MTENNPTISAEERAERLVMRQRGYEEARRVEIAAEQIRQAEQAAYERAAQDVCPYCDKRYPGWDAAEGPNEAGNWTHVADGNQNTIQLCRASAIYSRLAYNALAQEPEEVG